MMVGICGGTGSGKTTLARRILEKVGSDRVVLVAQDAYYKDASHLPWKERGRLNFDHPASVDFDLMSEQLHMLKEGRPIRQPVYDFGLHVRTANTLLVEPREHIVVEGILIFAVASLRALFDVKVFVDAAPDLRFIRRLRRDVRDRSRTLESVIQQYLETVRPMHLEFVEPARTYADILVPEGGKNPEGLRQVVEKLTRNPTVPGEESRQ
ncbi:MAG: uridine kinase [Acidobacteriota bacterium]